MEYDTKTAEGHDERGEHRIQRLKNPDEGQARLVELIAARQSCAQGGKA
jgi:hypothetical protein